MHIKIVSLLIFFFLITSSAFADEVIKAQNNAYRHNNKGLIYLEENYYYGAIKEFQIAIDLNPNTQATSIYYTNLGKTYEKIGYDELAKECFEKAVRLNALSFEPYIKMAENYKKLGILDEKIKEYTNKTYSPLNEIVIGLLYIQKGHITTGITILDDFCNKEPNLKVTKGVKAYIDKVVNEKLR